MKKLVIIIIWRTYCPNNEIFMWHQTVHNFHLIFLYFYVVFCFWGRWRTEKLKIQVRKALLWVTKTHFWIFLSVCIKNRARCTNFDNNYYFVSIVVCVVRLWTSPNPVILQNLTFKNRSETMFLIFMLIFYPLFSLFSPFSLLYDKTHMYLIHFCVWILWKKIFCP